MNVLWLTPRYTTFARKSIESVAPHIDRGWVLVRHNSVAELAGWLPPVGPVRHIRRFRARDLIDGQSMPPNIEVQLSRMPSLRGDASRPGLGEAWGRRILNRLPEDIDLVHAHFLAPMGACGALIAKERGIPLVVHGHGFDVYSLPFSSPAWRAEVDDVLGAAAAVVTVSNRNRAVLVDRLAVPAKKVHVVENGFDPDTFRPRPQQPARAKLGLPQDRFVLLTVASLVRIKGHANLIEALPRIRREVPDVLAVFVGDGPERGPLTRRARELGLEDVVLFAGERPHSEVSTWMNASDLFVLPSLNEGGPTVLYESLGCALPFVGTDVGGIAEVAAHEGLPITCPVGDPEALASLVVWAARYDWSKEQLLDVVAQLDWDSHGRRLADIYGCIS